MNEYAEYFALIRANDFEGAKAYLAVNPAAANARDNTGVPAVLRAMQTGDDDFCRWIIEQSLSKLNETDPDGATALHYAAAKGSPELLRYLVERVGWDPLRGTENGTQAELTVRSPEGETVVRTAPAACGTLRMEADGLTRRFYLDDTLFAELPRAEFLADEGRGCQKRFTGSMMGLYAVGADFTAKFGELSMENYTPDWAL